MSAPMRALLLLIVIWVGIPVLLGSACLAIAAADPAQEAVQTDDSIMPLYKPRKESTPRARIGGSLRGGEGDPVVVALVPDHVGLTLKAQPSLCWYLSQQTSFPLIFTLLDPRMIRPTLETTLPSPAYPGIHCILLKDYGVALDDSRQYRWAITLSRDPEQPSGDVVSGGMIERMPFDEGCTLGLPCASTCQKQAVYRYADAGLWYDALSCLHELIEAAPNDPGLRKKRAALLKQIDLHDVADYDLGQQKSR